MRSIAERSTVRACSCRVAESRGGAAVEARGAASRQSREHSHQFCRRRTRCGSRGSGSRRRAHQAVSDRQLQVRRAGSAPVSRQPIRWMCCRRSSTRPTSTASRAGCHSFGGEGLQNTVVAGCDSVEHGYSLTQEMCDLMAQKNLYYDPTLVRYTEPYMDDNDAKNTGGRFRMIPHLRSERAPLHRDQRREDRAGHRRRRLDLRAWHAGPRVRRAREAGWHDASRCAAGGNDQLLPN